jgi:SAM-dependent methyltransferase
MFGGMRFLCPCCGKSSRRFRSYKERPNASCPWCGSLERHRCLWLFLLREVGIESRNLRLLHVAPDQALAPLIRRLENVRYVSLDITRHSDVNADLTKAPFDSYCFDLIVCSHVLEHIPDDRAAMAEIARMLAPDGTALLLVPLDQRRSDTDEDPTVTDPAERLRRFGQIDHVRTYGLDFLSRLEEAGLVVDPMDYAERLNPGEREIFRLEGANPHRERLFICSRPP